MLWTRPERMHGKGVWATKYRAGWTVYAITGLMAGDCKILAEGLSEDEAKKMLNKTQVVITKLPE